MKTISSVILRLAALILAFSAPGAAADVVEQRLERLLAAPAASVEAGLPEIPFGDWLDGAVPRGSARFVTASACDGGPGEACLSIEFAVVSRHRNLRLLFGPEEPVFRGGEMWAEELEGVFAAPTLAGLPDLLRRAMRPYPLDCPDGTELRLRESYAGLYEWCEDTAGLRQGPGRTWFSTGIYLMERGEYADGEKQGEWFECDRFERCWDVDYEDDVRVE